MESVQEGGVSVEVSVRHRAGCRRERAVPGFVLSLTQCGEYILGKQAWEVVQSGKCLPCKCEDLNLIPRTCS